MVNCCTNKVRIGLVGQKVNLETIPACSQMSFGISQTFTDLQQQQITRLLNYMKLIFH